MYCLDPRFVKFSKSSLKSEKALKLENIVHEHEGCRYLNESAEEPEGFQNLNKIVQECEDYTYLKVSVELLSRLE